MPKCKPDDYYETDPNLFKILDDIFHFEWDAAANAKNTKVPDLDGKKRHFNEEDDSLAQDWSSFAKVVFINPPFSKIANKDAFIEKASRMANKGVTTVMVLPAKTDTGSFHDFIWKRPNVQVEFLRGRPRFYMNGEPTENTGWSAIMVVVFWAAREEEDKWPDWDLNGPFASDLSKALKEWRPAKKSRKAKGSL